MTSELLNLELDWKKELEKLAYVGELALPRDDVDRLCLDLCEDAPRRPVALTVLAVNCAYYYLDNEGFWPHFCDKLGLQDSTGTKEYLGWQIEKYLKSTGKLYRERTGPFRYVGAIIEQCGITRKHIPAFVDFLRDIGNRYGWDGFLGIDYNRYKNLVPDYGSKYLLNFLKDESGWEFVRGVARNLSQLERGIVTYLDLERVKGYHPSFWVEISDRLKFTTTKQRNRAIPYPVLFYDVSNNSIRIVLDAEYANRSKIRLDGKFVNNSSISLDPANKDDFQEVYRFEALADENVMQWSPMTIRGWVPDQAPYAIFHETRGYCDDIHNLKPGNYLLVAKSDIIVPDELLLSHIDRLSLYCGFFNTYEISITATSDLSVFGIAKISDDTPYLSWVGDFNKFMWSADTREIFVDRLPQVEIHNHHAFTSGDYILVAEIDGRQFPVRDIGDGKVDLGSLGFKSPGKGGLWIEATGRRTHRAGQRIVDLLSFGVIGRCYINGPKHLLSDDDAPEISLKAPPNYSITFNSAQQIDERGTLWQINPRVALAEGTLSTSYIQIRVAYRLYRARMTMVDGRSMLTSNDIDSGAVLVAEGIPGAPVDVYLAAPDQTYKLCSSGNYGKTGCKEITTFAFRDVMLSNHPVCGRFELGYKDRVSSTSLYYLDVSEACTQFMVNHNEGNVAPNWLSFCDPAIENVFRTLCRILDGGYGDTDSILDTLLPPELRQLAFGIVYSAHIFDGLKVSIPIELSSSDIAATTEHLLEWYQQVLKFTKGPREPEAARALLKAYPEVNCFIAKRWREVIKNLINKLEDIVDIEDNFTKRLREWTEEVKGQTKDSYKGYIANLKNGQDLVTAWKLYYKHNRLDQAYHTAQRIIHQSDGVVHDLALLLSAQVLKKLGQQYTSDDLTVETMHPSIKPYCQRLHATDMAIQFDEFCLPIRDEDKQLYNSI